MVMKNIVLLLTTALVLFCSCGEEPQNTEPKVPTLPGSWRTVHQHYSVTTDLHEEHYKDLKQKIEREVDVDVSEARSYRLTLRDDGTGSGSGVRRHDERYDFDFTWQSSDVKLSISEAGSGYGGVFFTYDWIPLEQVDWEVEELTIDKMVLLFLEERIVDALDENGNMFGWLETNTYRYTFERVE